MDREIALQENRRLLAENGRLTKYVRDLDRMLTSVGMSGDDFMSSKSVASSSSASFVATSVEEGGQSMLSMLSQGGLRGVVDVVVASNSGSATAVSS